jgi:hypothetical protein
LAECSPGKGMCGRTSRAALRLIPQAGDQVRHQCRVWPTTDVDCWQTALAPSPGAAAGLKDDPLLRPPVPASAGALRLTSTPQCWQVSDQSVHVRRHAGADGASTPRSERARRGPYVSGAIRRSAPPVDPSAVRRSPLR